MSALHRREFKLGATSRRRGSTARLLLLAALLAAGGGSQVVPGRAFASTLERGGTGARELGLAGAGAAAADGAAAVYDNPALLAAASHAEALLSLSTLRYGVQISRGGGAERWPTVQPKPLVLGTMALALPLLRDRLGVGLVVHLPLSRRSRLLSYEARRPQLPLWQGLGERLAIALSAGLRLTPWLSIGATAHVAADLDARADFALGLGEGRFSRQELDVRLKTRLVPAVAAQLTLGPRVGLLLRWRGAYQVGYRVPLTLDVAGAGPVALQVSGVGLLSPDVATVAAVWRPRASLRLVATLRYERWSQLPPLSPRVSLEAGEAPPWLAAYAAPPDPGAADIVVAQLAGDLVISTATTVRAGLGFRPTPLPKATGQASWLDSHAIEVAAGASWRASPRLVVDIGVRWTHLLPRRVAKAADDPIGFVGVSGDLVLLALTLRPSLDFSPPLGLNDDLRRIEPPLALDGPQGRLRARNGPLLAPHRPSSRVL